MIIFLATRLRNKRSETVSGASGHPSRATDGAAGQAGRQLHKCTKNGTNSQSPDDIQERLPELRQEIFELLFDAANIATFAPEDKIKYEYAMTTERDIRNQIRYAEKKGMEKGTEQIARRMLDGKMPIEKIIEFTGLTEEQVRAL